MKVPVAAPEEPEIFLANGDEPWYQAGGTEAQWNLKLRQCIWELSGFYGDTQLRAHLRTDHTLQCCINLGWLAFQLGSNTSLGWRVQITEGH